MKYKIREQLLEILKQEVVGPEPSHIETLNQSNGEEIIKGGSIPKLRYGAGVLFPRVLEALNSSVCIDELDVMNDVSQDQSTVDVTEGIDDEQQFGGVTSRNDTNGAFNDEQSSYTNDSLIKMTNALKPSAMGLTFVVTSDTDEFTIKVNAAVYKKKSYNCKHCNDSGISKTDRNKKSCIYCYRYKNSRKEIDAYFRIPLQYTCIIPLSELKKTDVINNLTIEDSELPILKDLGPVIKNKGLRLVSKIRKNKDLDDKFTMVNFTLINENVAPFNEEKNYPEFKNSHCFFQVEFSVELNNENFKFEPIQINQGLYSEEDKNINNLLYRNKPTFGIGHGCAVIWDQNQLNQNKLKTESIPIFEMQKIDAEQSKGERFSGIDLSFNNLSDSAEKKIILSNLKKLSNAYKNWLHKMEKKGKSFSEVLRNTAENNITKCFKALNRMNEGIAILENNETAMRAFMLMNRAILFQHLRSRQNEREWKLEEDKYDLIDEYVDIDIDNKSTWPENVKKYTPSWFPYQISFILINLKSIVEPECKDRDNVECLWFPTGGGKTEAYLGLIGFTIFHRRLLNPQLKGVTAVMRYTLRLLTAQQFQRASSLIAACEFIRNEIPNELGDNTNRVSIGLWVGSSLSPNYRGGEFGSVSNYHSIKPPGSIEENKLVINKCPWCAASMGKTAVLVGFESGKKEIRTLGYILRRIQGTRRNTVRYECANDQCHFSNRDNYLPIYVVDEDIYDFKPDLLIGTVDKFARLPWEEEQQSINLFRHKPDEQDPPDLIIQDELHLISGPLGSVVGIYENTIQTIFSKRMNNKRIYPKIIASTATVTRASDQMSQLYNNRFDNELFKKEMVNVFPNPVIDYNDSFFGKELSDPEKSRIYVGLNTTAYQDPKTSQVRIITSLLQGVKSLDVNKESDRDPYWTLLMYYNSIRELSGASTLVDQDIIAYLQQIFKRKYPDEYESIYNVSKEERNSVWAKSHSRSPFLDKIELAARQTKDITEALKQLEAKYPEETMKPIDICLATNMVSVGVDISRLGVMLVAGQPKTTSEYIQATSRIGRMHPGIVFVCYNNSRSRDKSHFEQFISYHQKIYSMVEPTSITPFSDPVRNRALHAQIFTLAKYFGVRNATDYPDQNIKEKIEEILVTKVACTDQYELTNTKKQIKEIFERWEKYPQLAHWGNMNGFDSNTDDGSLMHPFGKEPLDRIKAHVFPTLTSMRNVDAECQLTVIPGYPE